MSNCCTPLFVKVPFLSPTGSIRLSRGTGDAPSCGYYENYTGNPDISGYDYHEVNIQYNTGSGVWTFSGDATGFNDSNIYVSEITGDPCNPIGSYTYSGALYDVIVEADPFGLFPIYEFESSFQSNKSNVWTNGIGSGIHLEKDVVFNFSFLDTRGSVLKSSESLSFSNDIEAIVYDVLDINGVAVYPNYFSGYKTSLKITEQQNIDIFGSYQKDFGIRVKAIDPILKDGGAAEYYVYGNNLYIDAVELQDNSGTKSWLVNETGVSDPSFLPSGSQEERVSVNVRFPNSTKYTNGGYVDLYASTSEEFNMDESTFVERKTLKSSQKAASLNIYESLGLETNKDYWFKAEGSSNIGKGNTVNFGPAQIVSKKAASTQIATEEVKLSYNSASTLDSFKTGSVAEDLTGVSGIIDRVVIDTNTTGSKVAIYDGVDFDFYTVPTNKDGSWAYTSFEYSFEFKDLTDPYKNLSKNIKITATGTSTDPLNSGMPLFNLKDYNTGQVVELEVNYVENGFYLVSNTGHDYQKYKYNKKAF